MLWIYCMQQYFSFRIPTVGTLYLERRLDYSQVQTIELIVNVKVNKQRHSITLMYYDGSVKCDE